MQLKFFYRSLNLIYNRLPSDRDLTRRKNSTRERYWQRVPYTESPRDRQQNDINKKNIRTSRKNKVPKGPRDWRSTKRKKQINTRGKIELLSVVSAFGLVCHRQSEPCKLKLSQLRSIRLTMVGSYSYAVDPVWCRSYEPPRSKRPTLSVYWAFGLEQTSTKWSELRVKRYPEESMS